MGDIGWVSPLLRMKQTGPSKGRELAGICWLIYNGVVSYRFNNYLNVGGIIQSLEGLNEKKKSCRKKEFIFFLLNCLSWDIHPSFPWCSWFSGLQSWTELQHWLS